MVEGEVVYADYGNKESFLHLQAVGVSVKNRIVLMRIGKMYRGNKVCIFDLRDHSSLMVWGGGVESLEN